MLWCLAVGKDKSSQWPQGLVQSNPIPCLASSLTCLLAHCFLASLLFLGWARLMPILGSLDGLFHLPEHSQLFVRVPYLILQVFNSDVTSVRLTLTCRPPFQMLYFPPFLYYQPAFMLYLLLFIFFLPWNLRHILVQQEFCLFCSLLKLNTLKNAWHIVGIQKMFIY